jgi:hypothetical protein
MTLQKQSDIGHALKNIVAMDGVRGKGFSSLPSPFLADVFGYQLLWCSGQEARIHICSADSHSFVVNIHGSAKFCLVDTMFECLLLRDCCFSCLI